MKKFLALVMAMMMVLAMGTAFAEQSDYSGLINKAPKFTKKYIVNNGTAPAETFTFNFAFDSYEAPTGEDFSVDEESAPKIASVTANFEALSETSTQDVTIGITATDFPYVGKYIYNMTEVDANTEGVTYNTTPLKLVVTVLHDANNANQYVAVVHVETITGSKEATLENKYDAGQLTVTKKVAGNVADMEAEFDFTVKFTAGDNDIIKSAIVNDGAKNGITVTAGTTENTYTFKLGHNDSVTFSNLPAGVTYEVTEVAENYTSASVFSDNTKTISANDKDTVEFTNTLNTGVDTGMFLDNAPYIMIMGLVVLAGVAMMMKRRAYND